MSSPLKTLFTYRKSFSPKYQWALGSILLLALIASFLPKEEAGWDQDSQKQTTLLKRNSFHKKLLGSKFPHQTRELASHKRWIGKASTPLSAHFSFEWINQEAGWGKAKVQLAAESFLASSWNYQWVLPDNVSASRSHSGEFAINSYENLVELELEVRGLDSASNQNIIIRLQPTARQDSAMAVVIATHFEQTEEAKISSAYSKKSFPQTALRGHSTKPSSESSLKGIQF